MENDEKQQKPQYIQPLVHEYRPEPGEFITRPSFGSTYIAPTDPHAPQQGYDTYKYALTALHPQVAPALRFIVEAPFWVDWSFQPVNNYDDNPEFEKADNLIIKLINYQIERLEHETFENTLKIIWSDAFIFGFSVSEMVFEFDNKYVCVKSIKPHAPYDFNLYTDEGHNLDQLFYNRTGVYVNRSGLGKFLILTYPYLKHGNYYGQSGLQSIYFDVKVLDILERAKIDGVRRLSIRPLLHYYQSENMDAKDLQEMKKALYNIDSGSLIDLPATTDAEGKNLIPQHEIKVLEDRASAEGMALVTDMLDIIYKRINRTLGLPDDLGFSNAEIGSYAKAKEEMNLYTQTIVNNQGLIENFVNRQLVPALVRHNYPTILNDRNYKLPRMRFGSVEEDFDTAKADMINELINSGVISLRSDLGWVREELRLPAPSLEHNPEPKKLDDETVGMSMSERNKLKRIMCEEYGCYIGCETG